MMLDCGMVQIYALSHGADAHSPIKKTKLADEWFGELSLFTEEYYAAAANNVHVDRRVRVWQNHEIQSGQIAEIDGVAYDVGRVYHGKDSDGIPITDISLSEGKKAREVNAYVQCEY